MSKEITVDEYREQVSGWPETLDRYAERALDLPKDHPLYEAASEYLDWEREFLRLLEEHDIELG